MVRCLQMFGWEDVMQQEAIMVKVMALLKVIMDNIMKQQWNGKCYRAITKRKDLKHLSQYNWFNNIQVETSSFLSFFINIMHTHVYMFIHMIFGTWTSLYSSMGLWYPNLMSKLFTTRNIKCTQNPHLYTYCFIPWHCACHNSHNYFCKSFSTHSIKPTAPTD